VSEYAREYLEQHQIRTASKEDFQKIVKHQCLLFKNRASFAHEIFDTDLFVIRIWNDEVFKLKLPELEILPSYNMDIHFLCAPDVEWEADALRSAPARVERERLFEKYKIELRNSQVNFTILSGSLAEKKSLILSSVRNSSF
jgi:nicotinamide riboside kinase